ncbi:MAG TPA: hypothetical protein DHW34_01730 [Actinobacteria bacterium]|nr:hypothetical protein [Actinomycetota bacterium]
MGTASLKIGENASVSGDEGVAASSIDATSYFLLGVEHHSAGDVRSAAQWFERAHAADPTDAAILSALASALLEAGQATQSIARHQEWVDRQPEEAAAWFGLGRSLLLLDRHGDAVEALTRACALRPDLRHYADQLRAAQMQDPSPIVHTGDDD